MLSRMFLHGQLNFKEVLNPNLILIISNDLIGNIPTEITSDEGKLMSGSLKPEQNSAIIANLKNKPVNQAKVARNFADSI